MMKHKKTVVTTVTASLVLLVGSVGYYALQVQSVPAIDNGQAHVAQTIEQIAVFKKQLHDVEQKMSHMYQAMDATVVDSNNGALQAEHNVQDLEQQITMLTENIAQLLKKHQQQLAAAEEDKHQNQSFSIKQKIKHALAGAVNRV